MGLQGEFGREASSTSSALWNLDSRLWRGGQESFTLPKCGGSACNPSTRETESEDMFEACLGPIVTLCQKDKRQNQNKDTPSCCPEGWTPSEDLRVKDSPGLGFFFFFCAPVFLPFALVLGGILAVLGEGRPSVKVCIQRCSPDS